MAFSKKFDAIKTLKPDLLIIQECAEKDISNIGANFKHWVGSNKNKGLAVLAFDEQQYHIDKAYDNDIHWTIPVISKNLNILAIWAHKGTSNQFYIDIVRSATDRYSKLLSSKNSIFIGDFNNNSIWDKKIRYEKSWQRFIEEMKTQAKFSLYHSITGEKHGEETQNSLYMYRRLDKGYHIDYAFCSMDMIKNSSIKLGNATEWIEYSDHVPLIIDIEV